jgi:hypothetical protein
MIKVRLILLAFTAWSASAASAPLPGTEGAPGLFGGFVSTAERPSRFAQHSPVPPRSRAVSNTPRNLQGRTGESPLFEDLLSAAQARGRGEYLGVEPDISRNIYRFKFMRPGGNVVWVDVDGRTARVLAEQD